MSTIITKIQKLVAKAKSAQEIGNVSEAAAFSAKVTELLTTHNLAMADLNTEDQSDVIGDKTDDLTITRQHGKWTVSLLTVLCQYNFCHSIYHSSTKGFRYNNRGRMVRVKDKAYTVTIVGQPENVEVVKYLHDVLRSQFERLGANAWKEYINDARQKLGFSKGTPQYKKPWSYSNCPNRSKYITSFYLGAVNGVHEKLEEKQREAESVHGSKITDLVLVKDAAVNEWVGEHFPNLKSMQSRRRSVHGSAYNKGEQVGRSASMAKGVSTGDSVATRMLN